MESPNYKAVITVEIEGHSPDQFGMAVKTAFDLLSFGFKGCEGTTPNGTKITCNVDSNLPSDPMAMPRMLDMFEKTVRT
ncbi:hypothetical protein [Pseudomonas sp. P108]|uniref:hypothetical protein n=1 Tax=Pseudomonas sp. P108 TaxID=1837993 RepID=UPI002934646A|nr:hypothetical protein [Pseudomonas sp. P108]WNZ87579.1 hypothetical protein QOM10_30295 [Pseudomonas sp. P108]